MKQVTNSQYLNWEKVESVLIPLPANTTGSFINIAEYFVNPSFSSKTKIVGISVDLDKPNVVNGLNLVSGIQLNRFTLNLLNDRDEHVLKDYPLSDLNILETFGRIRIFDLEADLRKSYVQNTDGTAVSAPGAIFFTFYTLLK